MPSPTHNQLEELFQEFRRHQISYRDDLATRILYSTDASIYQIEPLGVVFPRNADELSAAVELTAARRIPILARGAGSSLAGQAIGAAIILDCSRHLNRILEINPEQQSATVEPGVILNSLNRAVRRFQLQFGPDPASGERATIGGSIANNATGAHSIQFGMAADHLISVETILGNGSLANFEEISLAEAERRSRQNNGLEARLYRACLQVRERYAEAIRQRWPRTWRRAAGYNLNYLLPWSPAAPPLWASDLPYPPISERALNLAPLLAGSEGTLGVIRKATIRLVSLPRHTVLGVLSFSSLAAACETTPAILERKPAAVELIPESIIKLARSVPAYAPQLGFVSQLSPDGNPAALLVVEFSGDDPAHLRQQALALAGYGETHPVLLAETSAEQKRVWDIRRMGLGILASRPGDVKSVSIIEDISVPVTRLGEFVREMERIFANYGIQGDFYAHASAGCLHIRPLMNIKTPEGRRQMRQVAQDAAELAIRLQGAVSGEHGVGIARAEWLPRFYGEELMAAFRAIKQAADPYGVLNPGKLLDAPPLDSNLRYGDDYHPQAWTTVMDFSRQGGLVGAIELCNGAGVCRKNDGVMCPSFQATQDEMHSTRGRANLLRAMISGRFDETDMAERALYEALDLCLACKGCKAECPSAVDVAKLRYEFLHHYYRSHRRRLRDYLFGRIDDFARFGRVFHPLANRALSWNGLRRLVEQRMGISARRNLPQFQPFTLSELTAKERRQLPQSPIKPDAERVLFLSDTFTEYFYPETGLAALRVLQAAGCVVEMLPLLGAGRTLLSKGFLPDARQRAEHLLAAIERLDPEEQAAVVGVEPSEILTLRDEYLDLLPGDRRIERLAERAYMIDEFLIRPGKEGNPRIQALALTAPEVEQTVHLHGHCYQKAQPPAADGFPSGLSATVKMLQAAGYAVQVIEAGCCGMAGAFGYEREHYALSMQIGELALFPALRSASRAGEGVLAAAAGISCQAQIEDGTGIKPFHPIRLVYERLKQN